MESERIGTSEKKLYTGGFLDLCTNVCPMHWERAPEHRFTVKCITVHLEATDGLVHPGSTPVLCRQHICPSALFD